MRAPRGVRGVRRPGGLGPPPVRRPARDRAPGAARAPRRRAGGGDGGPSPGGRRVSEPPGVQRPGAAGRGRTTTHRVGSLHTAAMIMMLPRVLRRVVGVGLLAPNVLAAQSGA